MREREVFKEIEIDEGREKEAEGVRERERIESCKKNERVIIPDLIQWKRE